MPFLLIWIVLEVRFFVSHANFFLKVNLLSYRVHGGLCTNSLSSSSNKRLIFLSCFWLLSCVWSWVSHLFIFIWVRGHYLKIKNLNIWSGLAEQWMAMSLLGIFYSFVDLQEVNVLEYNGVLVSVMLVHMVISPLHPTSHCFVLTAIVETYIHISTTESHGEDRLS